MSPFCPGLPRARIDSLLFVCFLLLLFYVRFRLWWSHSTLRPKQWGFHQECLDRPPSQVPRVCELENAPSHAGVGAPCTVGGLPCGRPDCVAVSVASSLVDCVTEGVRVAVRSPAPSCLLPPASCPPWFSLAVLSMARSASCVVCLFVYDLSGEEKKYRLPLSLCKSVFRLKKGSLLCLFLVKHRDCQVQKQLTGCPPPNINLSVRRGWSPGGL